MRIEIHSINGVKSLPEKQRRIRHNVQALKDGIQYHKSIKAPSWRLRELRQQLNNWQRKQKYYNEVDRDTHQASIFGATLYWFIICVENSNFNRR